MLALWLFSHNSFFPLKSLWHCWQGLKIRPASRLKSPIYKPQGELRIAFPGVVLQLAPLHTWMLLSPSDHRENYPVWLCLLIQPIPALPLLPQWKQAASDSRNTSELLVLEEQPSPKNPDPSTIQKEKSVKLTWASYSVSTEWKPFLRLFSSPNIEHTLLTLAAVLASYERSKIIPASWISHCSYFASPQKKHKLVYPMFSQVGIVFGQTWATLCKTPPVPSYL